MEKLYHWVWCLHCERCYEREHARVVDVFAGVRNVEIDLPEDERHMAICFYNDCDASLDLDGWSWRSVRDVNPNYPVTPKIGVVYPLYKSAAVEEKSSV